MQAKSSWGKCDTKRIYPRFLGSTESYGAQNQVRDFRVLARRHFVEFGLAWVGLLLLIPFLIVEGELDLLLTRVRASVLED